MLNYHEFIKKWKASRIVVLLLIGMLFLTPIADAFWKRKPEKLYFSFMPPAAQPNGYLKTESQANQQEENQLDVIQLDVQKEKRTLQDILKAPEPKQKKAVALLSAQALNKTPKNSKSELQALQHYM